VCKKTPFHPKENQKKKGRTIFRKNDARGFALKHATGQKDENFLCYSHSRLGGGGGEAFLLIDGAGGKSGKYSVGNSARRRKGNGLRLMIRGKKGIESSTVGRTASGEGEVLTRNRGRGKMRFRFVGRGGKDPEQSWFMGENLSASAIGGKEKREGSMFGILNVEGKGRPLNHVWPGKVRFRMRGQGGGGGSPLGL